MKWPAFSASSIANKMSKHTRSATRSTTRAPVQVTGPARATRARTRAAATQACSAGTEDLSRDLSEERPKKRTEEQAIDEKRRKRAKTCVRKLGEFSLKTETPAFFAYFDPKTRQWDGKVCMPDGQALPENIGHELTELQKRGPRVRRRGRAKKNLTHNLSTFTFGSELPIRTPTQNNESDGLEEIRCSDTHQPIVGMPPDVLSDPKTVDLAPLAIPDGSNGDDQDRIAVENTLSQHQFGSVPFSPVFALDANMMSGEAWMPMIEVQQEPSAFQDEIWNAHDLGAPAICLQPSDPGNQQRYDSVPQIAYNNNSNGVFESLSAHDYLPLALHNKTASTERKRRIEKLRYIVIMISVKLDEDKRAIKSLFLQWDSLFRNT